MAQHTFTSPRRIFLGLTAIAVLCAGSLGSAAAASAAPRNDDFADATALRLGRDVRGNITGATKQRGEPPHAGSLATHSVWYRFSAKRRTGVLLGTCSASFDSVVAVYSGRRLTRLREVDFNNDGCGSGGGGSRVSFTARRGVTYRIAVAGFTAGGRFKLTVDRIFTPLNDDLADAVALTPGSGISASTTSATRELREPGHADNDPHTVWFKVRVATQTDLTLNACNGSYPTLTVYTGSSMTTLRRVATESDCSARFTALPGITYRIVAEDYSAGSFRISL